MNEWMNKVQNYNISRKKTGENVGVLKSGDKLLDIISKVWSMKAKVDKIDLLKVKKKKNLLGKRQC